MNELFAAALGLLAQLASNDYVVGLLGFLSHVDMLWPAMKLLGAVAAFLFCFWVLYVATMAVYRLHLAGELKRRAPSRFTLGMCYLLVGLAVAVDALAQYSLASLLFLDWPRRGEHLVTDRLQRYVAQPRQDWRSWKAHAICSHLLDLFDPTGDHCNRGSKA